MKNIHFTSSWFKPFVRNLLSGSNLKSKYGIVALSFAVIYLIKYIRRYKITHKTDTAKVYNPSKIVVIENSDRTEYLDTLIRKTQKCPVLGLDCEWVCDEQRHPIALLQLATNDGYCVLIRFCKLTEIPQKLTDFLEDPSIIKIGAAIRSDVRLLHSDYGIIISNCLDINTAAKIIGLPNGSLKQMAENVLNINLNKDKLLQCSNWEAESLSEMQIKYAALDALIPVKIVDRMFFMKACRNLEDLNVAEVWSEFLSIWGEVLDVQFTFKGATNTKRMENRTVVIPKRNDKVSIKGTFYENCFLEDPGGHVLCVCNNKKLDWYLERGLGTEVNRSPRTVRLNFQPRPFPKNPDALYYTKRKENQCVVCGQTNSLRRKNIVPYEYRTHFPKEMKDYKSHDVVLLCAFCHARSVLYDQKLRHELITLCDAPIIQRKLSEKDRQINKLKYAANALLKRNSAMSSARIQELENFLCDNYKCDKVTESVLQEIISVKVPTDCSDTESHGRKVVKHFQEKDELNTLEIKWRTHFVDTMKPRHLPELWSIFHDSRNFYFHK